MNEEAPAHLTMPEISPASINLPNARGYIERMSEDDSQALRVEGWMLSHNGPFEKIVAKIDDNSLPVKRLHRSGIARVFPWIPHAADAGFDFSFPLRNDSRLSAGGVLQFALVGSNNGQEVAVMPGGYYRSSTSWTPPPERLMMRVAHTKHAFNFYASGMTTCVNLLSYAARYVQLSELRKVLDWGCGSGRLTPHLLHCLPGAKIYGTDIDPEAVEWTAGRYPNAHIKVCQIVPPLDYDSSSFDLILAGSVFTHLTRADQLIWLQEMRRLLTDGGLLIATTHGEFAGRFSFQEKFEEVFAGGFSDERRDKVLDGIAPDDYYRATFQSKEHTVNTWGQELTIVGHIAAGYANFQDVFILRKDLRD